MTKGKLILETPRLVLTTWEEDDAGLISALHSTIETSRYLSGAAPWSMEKAERRLRIWMDDHPRLGVAKYKLLSSDDGRFIGRACFSLFEDERERGEFELGYSIRREEWGKGYATEISRALADWFFQRRLAERFIAFTHPDNDASQKVLKKVGMRSRMPIVIDALICPAFELTADCGKLYSSGKT